MGTVETCVAHDQLEALGVGDRIAVTCGGKVRQVATPRAACDDPAEAFVAGFLGSPPMNLEERDARIVGFRPETFLPARALEQRDGPVSPWLRVHRIEHLGADRLPYGVLRDPFPDGKVIVSVPALPDLEASPGQVYEFAVKEADIKFFARTAEFRAAPRPFRARR